MKHVVAVACLALICSACSHSVGRDFPRPDPAKVVPGVTTLDQIVAMYGPPFNHREDTVSTGPRETKSALDAPLLPGRYLNEVYGFATGAGGDSHGHNISFCFWNGTLIWYDYVSDFEKDATNFDDSRTGEIHKGVTTKAQIVAIFGEPVGHGVYPAVARQGDEEYVYDFFTRDKNSSNSISKTLEIVFDGTGRVADFHATATNKNGPGPIANPVLAALAAGKNDH